jgi:hypothetical protein
MITEKRTNILTNKRNRKFIITTASVLLTLAVIVGAFAIYVGDYYRADTDAIEAFAPMQEVTIQTLKDGTMIFRPENPVAGLIFYPGGKVEHTSYQPLMAACAEQGIFCVLVEMPCNLAVLDMNAADGVQEQYPEIENWYIGGHSLGGAMAASYLGKHLDQYQGLILLGSYSTSDLSGTDLKVLSVYGSEDKVLNREKYDKYKPNLPAEFTEIIIDGGCHAYFGMYGAQDGDGTPTVSNDAQIQTTADAIARLVGGNE